MPTPLRPPLLQMQLHCHSWPGSPWLDNWRRDFVPVACCMFDLWKFCMHYGLWLMGREYSSRGRVWYPRRNPAIDIWWFDRELGVCLSMLVDALCVVIDPMRSWGDVSLLILIEWNLRPFTNTNVKMGRKGSWRFNVDTVGCGNRRATLLVNVRVRCEWIFGIGLLLDNPTFFSFPL